MAPRLASARLKAAFSVAGSFALLALFLAPGASLAAPHMGAPTMMPAAPALLKVHPSLTTVHVNITDPSVPAWSTPGQIWINFTVTVVGAPITAGVSNASVLVLAEVGQVAPYTFVPYSSWAVSVDTDNQTSFSTQDTEQAILPNTSAWVTPANTWLANGRYTFEVFFYPQTSGDGAFGHASMGSALGGGNGTTQMLVNQSIGGFGRSPFAGLISPTPGSTTNSPGIGTVIANYSGDWVTSAWANITDPSGGNVTSVDMATSYIEPAWQLNHVVVLSTSVSMILTGVYTVHFTLWSWNGGASPVKSTSSANFTVTSNVQPQPVWINTTTYKNNSGLGGATIASLGPGGTAALLMVVGVIIGIIAALLVGRPLMMGGTPASTAPAQPWSGTKGGANECSVCHQSFATEAELKEHSKTAHGM